MRYVLLGSDCQSTLQAALIRQTRWGVVTEFKSSNRKVLSELFGFGDGSVTKESLLGVTHQSGQSMLHNRIPALAHVFVCENHFDLPASPTYLDNVLHMLLDDK